MKNWKGFPIWPIRQRLIDEPTGKHSTTFPCIKAFPDNDRHVSFFEAFLIDGYRQISQDGNRQYTLRFSFLQTVIGRLLKTEIGSILHWRFSLLWRSPARDKGIPPRISTEIKSTILLVAWMWWNSTRRYRLDVNSTMQWYLTGIENTIRLGPYLCLYGTWQNQLNRNSPIWRQSIKSEGPVWWWRRRRAAMMITKAHLNDVGDYGDYDDIGQWHRWQRLIQITSAITSKISNVDNGDTSRWHDTVTSVIGTVTAVLDDSIEDNIRWWHTTTSGTVSDKKDRFRYYSATMMVPSDNINDNDYNLQ